MSTSCVRQLKHLLLTPILSLLFIATHAASQPGTATQQLDQLITLEARAEMMKTVLARIEKQADVHFMYSKELIGADRRVSVAAVNKPLAAVLSEMLAPLQIRYELVPEGIVLAPAAAAEGIVRGRIVDSAKGDPLPGVTVRIEGTLLGTYTDARGEYILPNVPAGPQTVIFSSIGYVTRRQPVEVQEGQTVTADGTLSEDQTQLSEVVVVGYGTTRKQDVTGSLATVSSKDFVQGQVTDPTRLIQGKVAGVQIAAGGGAPGEVATIRIRGGSSLNATNDPLIVIDGVPVDNFGIAGAGSALALVNPNDIETFTILKDASATAIYGSRASNGVIIITTKKGAAGQKMHVTLSSQVSRSDNYGKVNVLTGDEYRTLAAQVDALRPEGVLPDRSALLGTANTDWQKEIYRPAFTFDNSVSLTGSVKNYLPYRAGIGYLVQEGTLRTGRLARTTASVGVTPILFDNHLRIDINAKGSWAEYRFADQSAIGAAVRRDPTQPVYSGDSIYNGYTEWLDNLTGQPQSLTDRNPLALINDRRDFSTVFRTLGNVAFDYKLHFFPDLHANLNLGMDLTRSNGSNFVPASSSISYTVYGFKRHYVQMRNNVVLDAYLNYRKLVSSHSFDATGGYSYQDFYRYSPSISNTVFTAADTLYNRNASIPFPDRTRYTLLSFYGRLNYNYKERYLFTGTLRADGSSHFAPKNHWGYYPAASVAWRASQEAFLADNRYLSELKLRGSYGVTGQQDVPGGDYPYLGRYLQGQSSVSQQFGDQYYITQRPAAYDANLRWEQTTTWDLGLDWGLFNNRLSGAVDIYLRTTDRLLSVVPVPAGTNLADYLLTNIGSLQNRGIEFTANYDILRSKSGVNWSINFNATMNRNKITSLTAIGDSSFLGVQPNAYQINSVGYPANSFFVLQQKYDDNGRPIEDNQDRTKMYVDQNGDGVINERDYVRYKSPAPKAILGFSSNVSYRGFSLAFTVRSNIGGYVYNNVLADRTAFTSAFPAQAFVLNASPGIYDTQFRNPQLNSDYYIQDASFVRFENVTVGYNLGQVIKVVPTLRVTAAVQNVWVITGYKGVNPEVFNGIDTQFYPLPRTFTVGLTAGI